MNASRFGPRRLGRVLWISWRHEITAAGKCVVLAGLIAALGTVTVQVPIYQVSCALAALFLVTMACGFLVLPNVAISGTMSERTIAGEPVTGRFVVTNRSWRPVYDLAIGFFGLPASIREEEPDRIVPVLGAHESIELTVTLVPEHRGVYELPPLRAYTTFPFQLFRIGTKRHPVPALTVLPRYESLIGLDVPTTPRYQPGGIALTSRVGESPEYVGNREYVPGEPARRLDFRSWARLGRPVVRDYQEEYYCRVALILDTYLPRVRYWGFHRDRQGRYAFGWPQDMDELLPQLEAAISLSAAIAEALSDGEYVIDLFAAGPALHVFRSGRHVAHFDNVLEILAGVGPCRTDPFEVVTPAVADEMASLSTAICVFLDWDASRRKLAQTTVEEGCRLKALIVRDGPTTEPFDDGEFDVVQFTPAEVLAGGIDAR